MVLGCIIKRLCMAVTSLAPRSKMTPAGWVRLMLVVLVAIRAEASSPPKLNFCRNRLPSECCRGVRDDDCAVPIRDTYCYCDDFCLEDSEEGSHDDCCPDFREVCLGEEGPSELNPRPETAVCIYKGVALPEGTYTFNCNECLCQNGQLDCENDTCLVDEEMLRHVNANPQLYGWTATNYSMFWGRKTKEGLVLRTGTLIPDDKTRNMLPILLRPDPSRLPREFDARLKEEWRGYISGVRDQGWCGASWAFSTLGVAQDRHMILNHGKSVLLAPQQLLSCSPQLSEGCNGGYIERAWNYMRLHGAVDEACYPYFSGVSGVVPGCLKDSKTVCKTYRTEPAYHISSEEVDIQWEIMTNGPVQALMWVKRDFFVYRSGVYRCPEVDREATALHSVRILGWGEEVTYGNGPTKYWIVANSWGTSWGEGGLFKIRRGTNECGIESFVLAVRGRRDPWVKNNSGAMVAGGSLTPTQTSQKLK